MKAHQKISYSLIIILGLSLVSCTTVKNIQFEIIQPPKVFLPNNYKKIVLVNAFNYSSELRKPFYALDSVAAENLIKGLHETYENSLLYNEDDLAYLHVMKNDSSLDARIYNWTLIDQICKKTESDLMVSLLHYSAKAHAQLVDYGTILKVVAKAKFSVIDPVERKVLDEYYLQDTIVWDDLPSYWLDLETQLKIDELYQEAGYWMGVEYAQRIFPTWVKVNRFYFNHEYIESQKADLYIQNGAVSEAAKNWLILAHNSNKFIASKACFNLALAFEMLDELDTSLSWINKAYELKPNKEFLTYKRIIEKRIEDKKMLIENKLLIE